MTIVKIVSLKDYQEKGRLDWTKPIKQYETSRAPWEFMKAGNRIDRRMLPKIKGMKFWGRDVSVIRKQTYLYLIYA